jgi:hypothetical protein
MRYRSQWIAYPYFVVALLLFGLQMVFGLLSVVKYLGPDPLLNILDFNVTKAIHTNLLIVWVLTGFMGATYYVVPEESRTEIYSERLAYWQLGFWTTLGVVIVVGYLFGWTAGNKLLEQPWPTVPFEREPAQEVSKCAGMGQAVGKSGGDAGDRFVFGGGRAAQQPGARVHPNGRAFARADHRPAFARQIISKRGLQRCEDRCGVGRASHPNAADIGVFGKGYSGWAGQRMARAKVVAKCGACCQRHARSLSFAAS